MTFKLSILKSAEIWSPA